MTIMSSFLRHLIEAVLGVKEDSLIFRDPPEIGTKFVAFRFIFAAALPFPKAISGHDYHCTTQFLLLSSLLLFLFNWKIRISSTSMSRLYFNGATHPCSYM